MTEVVSVGVLADKFHSVYGYGYDGKYIVFNEDAEKELKQYGVRYERKANLLFVPYEEGSVLLEIDSDLERKIEEFRKSIGKTIGGKKIDRKSSNSIGQINKQWSSSLLNKDLVDNGNSNVNSGSWNNKPVLSNGNSIVNGKSIVKLGRVVIETSLSEEKVKQIIRRSRKSSDKKTVSFYVDRRIANEFEEVLRKLWLDKRASKIIELLMAEFVERAKAILEDTGEAA